VRTQYPEIESPELVLVDPALAARARQRLVVRDDSPERLERSAPTRVASSHPDHASPLDDAAFHRLAAHAPVAAEPVASRPSRARRLALLTAAACATLSAGIVVAGLADGGEAPATSGGTALAPASVTTEAAGAPREAAAPSPARPGLRTASRSRRFVWAPAAGASGYHVELFRGSERVFAADTRRPEITIPASWTFERRRHRLEAVAYEWYVWPIVAGERGTTAIVQATFVARDR
jgi:hypothetical protein